MSILSDEQLRRHRIPLLLVACLQAFFGSGIFYGWASLYTLFLEAGVYRDLCEPDQQVCAQQKERLSFIYTVASSINLAGQLPWGCILDFLGPRVCNLWSTFLVITGFVLLSLSARGLMDGYMLAMCLIGGAGPGAQISLFHLSELFPPKRKSTVLSVVTGAFQLGFVVFLGFRLAFTHLGLSLTTLAMLYCIPLAILLLLGGVLWPDYPCIPPDDLDPLSFTSRRPSRQEPHALVVYEQRRPPLVRERAAAAHAAAGGMKKSVSTPEDASSAWKVSLLGRNVSSHEPDGDGVNRNVRSGRMDKVDEEQPLITSSTEGSPAESPVSYGSLPDPASSPSLHHVHRSLHRLRASKANPNLKGAAASKGFLHQLTNPSYLLCLVWMAICLFWANFYIGTAVEQLYAKSGFNVEATRHYTDLFTLLLPIGVLGIGMFGYLTDELGFSTSIACTSVFAVGFAATALWAPIYWQPLTFVFYSFFRSFLFSVMFAYLANEFGYRHFGLLSGIMLGVGGCLGFLQYPLVRKMVVRDVTHAKPPTANLADNMAQQVIPYSTQQQLADTTSFASASLAAAITSSLDDSSSSPGDDPSSDDPSSFHTVNELQFWSLLFTFYFSLYVFWKQRTRKKRLHRAIQEHTRQLEEATV